MRTFRSAAAAAAAALALAACERQETTPTPPAPPAGAPDAAAKPPRTAEFRTELPKIPALTEDVARKVLHDQVAQLAGDDLSRQALLYLAALGDRTPVNAFHASFLAPRDGEYDDTTAAAIGFEASLAYGEPDAAAKLVGFARKQVEADEADEYLVHALARVEGADREAAAGLLARIAEAGEEETALPALRALAAWKAEGARETFAKVAADAEAFASTRAAAATGLLRLGDPRGRDALERLAALCSEQAGDEALHADEVLSGFAVEGAVEAVPFVRSILDRVLAEDPIPMLEIPAAVGAVAAIHANGGGTDLIPWLRELAARDDGDYEQEASLGLYALGDDEAAKAVADELRSYVANWDKPIDLSRAVEILDVVARRGGGRKAPFAEIVSAAAQVRIPDTARPGSDWLVRGLNLAAAHAHLRGAAK